MQGRTYRFFQGAPLYPFGFGLSYSTFDYSKLNIKKTAGGKLSISTQVRNSSKIAGDEVAQLYTGSEKAAPWLAGFRRIHLGPGESAAISWTIDPSEIHGTIVTVAGAQPRDSKGVHANIAKH
jgi:beta-glucosidase